MVRRADRPMRARHPARAAPGAASTAIHARRIIFAIAPVSVRRTFLQCPHGARFIFADGYVAT
jgi:hypothetical protein